jgi:hypothetical protein
MSGHSALEIDGTRGVTGDASFEVRRGPLEFYTDIIAGAVLGAVCGLVLLVFAVATLPVPSRQQHEARLWFTAAPKQERLDLRAEWMDEHLAQAFEDQSILEDDAWQDYRVIHLPDVGKQLICSPASGPVKMGFAIPGRVGLTTIMPWDEEVAFDILTACDTRI